MHLDEDQTKATEDAETVEPREGARRETAPRERDPREEDPDFRNLPKGHQDLLRQRWRAEASKQELQGARRRDRLLQSVLEGVVVFVVLEWVLIGLSLTGTLIIVVIGAATGAAIDKAGAQRGKAALIALGGMYLIRSLVGWPFIFYSMIYFLMGTLFVVAARIPRENDGWGW